MNIRVALCVIVAATVMAACQGNSENEQVAKAPDISVAYPVEDTITLYASYPGYLSATKSLDLIGRVSGYQIATLYQDGASVKQGDTLFIIEPRQYEDAVAQAEAALQTAESQLYYAENNYTRMKEAAQSNAISDIDLIKSESAYHEAEAALKNAEAALQSARTQLSYCYVRAPFSGKVTASVFGDGAYINGSASTVLATMYQDYELFAYFNIDDAQYLRMVNNGLIGNKNFKVNLSFREQLRHNYSGRVDYVAPNINLSTGTLEIRVVVKNPHGELRDGLYTTINLPYGDDNSSLLIQDAAIGSDQIGKYVYVVSDSNRVEMRHIEIGNLYQDTLRVVNGGLTPQDRYVTRALLKVREGMEINPVVEK